MIALGSCEKIVDINGDYENGIAVFTLVQPGEKFFLHVSRSFTVDNSPSMVFSASGEYYDEIGKLYQEQVVIKDALVEVTVNGTDKYTMSFDASWPRYISDYVPKIGDEIALHVSADGYKDVYATTKVLEPQKIDIVNTEVVYKENGYDGTGLYLDPFERFGLDSVMNITMRIHDPKGERNYYRLKVRGVGDRYSYTGTVKNEYCTVTDVFNSTDVIFVDNLLTKPFGDWKAGMSNVFDDHLIDGSDYTFTVESRMMKGDNPRVVVELQTIPAEMYYFFKSYMQIRITTDDSYTSPIGLYSNVENGWGIFGSLSYDRHTISYR